MLLSISDLFFRDVNASYRAAVLFGGIVGKSTPAPADIQYVITMLQLDFPANEIELFPLGFRQVVRSLKVGAAVLVIGV